MSLKSRLALRFLIGLFVVCALLFIPAGSLRFWQGWAYLVIWFVPGLLAFTYFYKRDPELIKRRLRFNEKVGEQKRIMAFVYITCLTAFVLPGLVFLFTPLALGCYFTLPAFALLIPLIVLRLLNEEQPRLFTTTILIPQPEMPTGSGF